MSGAYRSADATVSAHDARAVTPGDATVFQVCRALYVGTGGTITLRLPDVDPSTGVGRIATFYNIPSGSVLPIQCDMVYATTGVATTASQILALY